MRSPTVFVALLALSTCVFGTGWDGQQMVNRPDADTAEGQPCIALDSAGCPWIVWDRNCTDTTMLYTRWQGNRWDEQSGAGANAPGVAVRLRPSICFDSRGRAWLAWHNVYSNDRRDIAACHWDDSLWTPEQHVSPPESTDLYFAPKVSCGGGQVWCVWYGGPSDGLPYSVFASRWDSLKGSWTPETRVSPPDSNHHWWCDVAVDSVGTPHVVWCTHPLYTVFYSYFDGQQWVEPIPVNDTTQVTASPWASPRIVIDRTGVIHLCFTGARVGASHRDIFYTRNDVSGWAPCQMVTRDSLYDEWYSDIAANRPDNVWVVWNRQNEGSDQFRVYASHWDGTAWSFEQRLDDTTSYYDFDPVVCLDDDGYPWVVWSGTTYGATDDVYYNRYMSHGSLVGGPHGACGRAFTLAVTSPARHGIRFSFSIAQNGRVGLVVFDVLGRCIKRVVDGVLPAGQHSAVWNRRMADGEPAPAGAYIGRLDAAGCVAKCRFTLVSD